MKIENINVELAQNFGWVLMPMLWNIDMEVEC
jgi:hypothetical protein